MEGAPPSAAKPVEPQAVLAPLTEAAIFLVGTVEAGSEPMILGLLPDIAGLTRSVGSRVPEGELSCVTGLGADLWDRLFGRSRPAGLHHFRELRGPRHTAVATPGDVLFHIRAHRFDLCFELAKHLVNRLAGHMEVVDEVHGFRSFDDRDFLGFVDGTENPAGVAARLAVVIGDEDPAFEGGSYVVVQKYLHDLPSWDALLTEEQERVVGRTKLSDIEMPDATKPSNSHVALNTIVGEDGEQHQIVRYNMPFGRVGPNEYGTYFIGYARFPEVIETMLTNMFVGKPPGNYDRVLDFSTAVTGNLFFVPSSDFLDGPASPRRERPGTGQPEFPASPGGGEEGSLGIGNLKGGSR
ncbi:MAG TPA: Dyp-type peroxidase [Acidimicrobiales bacterium]|nr:Dyp-type peroxidase [Acidimicrobiales bacterium]